MEKKKSKFSREVAKVVFENNPFEKKRATLFARPLRLAFVIHHDLFPERLLYLLTYISSIWGGYYSCLVSTNGNKLSDVDWENLNVYEPDKIVFCSNDKDSFASELVRRIRDEIAPFSLLTVDNWEVEKDIFNLNMQRDADPLVSSIPITIPMVHDLDKLKRSIEEEKSNVRIPAIDQNSPLVLYVAAQSGITSEHNRKLYLDWYKAKSIEFKNHSLKDYLLKMAEIESKFSPLDMTKLFTRTTIMMRGEAERPEGLNIVFTGNNFVQDLCLFWNLRLAQSIFRNSVILFLPFAMIHGTNGLKDFAEGIKLAPWVQRKINIFSPSVKSSSLKRFISNLERTLDSSVKINLIKKTISIAYFHTISVEETSETNIEKNVFSFKSPKPEFVDLSKGGEWGVDIKFIPPYEYPSFSKLNHFLCGSPKETFYTFYNGYWIRAAHEKFVHRASKRAEFSSGHLISDDQAYQEYFQDKGYEAHLTEKHSYAEGFLSLLQNPDILEDAKVIDFFWKLQKQEAYTYDTLCAELKKGDEGKDLIDDFVSKRILLRGMKFRCNACGLSRFYPINTLDEEMQCPGCLSYIQPPSRAPIMFRLNELATRAIEQGSIPVMLTHKFLKILSGNQTLRLFGIEVSKDNTKIDVDYITTYMGGLIFAECKDFKHGVSPKEKRETIRQLKGLIGLAKRTKASAVVLSTLLPFPSPDYDDFATQIEKMRIRNKISMQLLSLSGHGIVNLKQPDKLIEHPYLFD